MLKFTVVFILSALSIGYTEGYFWRTWYGTVPEDALVAGADSRGLYYIAKVWLPTQGIYIGQTFYGQTVVDIAWNTTGTNVATSSSVEVLCHDATKPFWKAANASITRDILDGQLLSPILGGRTSVYGFGAVYIGKAVAANGHSYVGSVHTDFSLHYVNELGNRAVSASYELLVLENHSNNMESKDGSENNSFY